MIAPDLISDSIPPLYVDHTGEHALTLMHEYNVNQLPVIENKKYCGLISMEEIFASHHVGKTIANIQPALRQPFAKNTAHVFDVMKTAVEFNVKVVPVVDDENNYLGLISAESCLRAFATLNSVKEEGGILELEISQKDYSLSEIAKIAEENNANILCLYTHTNRGEGVTEITLKVNTTELTVLVAAFERYNYEVKSIYNDTEYTEDLQHRYDSLMRYLNV